MITINRTLWENYSFTLHARFIILSLGTILDGIIGLCSCGFLFPIFSYGLLDSCWDELQRMKERI